MQDKLKTIIKTILADFHASPIQPVTPREVKLPVNSGKVITLIGPRRSGKSFYFFHLIYELIESGIEQKNILYLNFEDERLTLNTSDLDTILQAYQELYPDTNWKDCYLFFDEIQNIKGWEKFVRRCNDTITKNIFITGSNANLLSQEIATALRGRTLTYEILPLSFREFLTFKKIDAARQDSLTRSKVNKLFHEYLTEGGYPEIVLMNENLRIQALQEYFDVMTYRDLVERYEFTNLSVIKYFLKRIAGSAGSYLSLNKIYNELRSQGYKLDKNFVYDVHEAAKAVYLSLPVSKFDYSELKRINSDKKTYFIDNGLLNAISFKFSNDYGKLLENLCYLQLRREGREFYYFKDNKECDFILYSESKKPLPVQITYSLADPDTFTRETESLVYCCKKISVKQGVIISMDDEQEKTIQGIKVRFVSAIQYFLGHVKL